MNALLVEVDSPAKAKQLSDLLSSLDFVTGVSKIGKAKTLLAALQEHEAVKAAMVKKKNKAIAKYL